MDISRRRVVTLITVAFTGTIVTVATHGSAAAVAAAEPDRIARAISLTRQAMDAFPVGFWPTENTSVVHLKELRAYAKILPDYGARRLEFNRKLDEAFGYMLGAFRESLTAEDVRPVFNSDLGLMDDRQLGKLADKVVPTGILRSICKNCDAPILPANKRPGTNLTRFMRQHYQAILGA